ncbi:MFS transporter [Agromyces sp. NPDC058484]|uniref:MFS transporter n=1 Tax=Agromyces sp. NPDC058484 TaxID=3346524 RepID=UPI0036608222
MRERMLLGILVAAQFVVMLDTAVLNVALPTIGSSLGLGPVGTAWVLNAYFLVFGATLLVSGRASHVIGRRRMFLIGAALLLAGAIVGAMASTGVAVVAARLIQALGAAALSPAAMSMILARTDGKARVAAMSAWGAASTVGGATGVAVGGLVTAVAGWNAVFAITGAAAGLALVLGLRLLPMDAPGPRRSFDGPGASLATGAAFAVAFAVLSVPGHGWLSVPVLGAGAALLLALLVIRERRAADPLFPAEVMRSRRVAVALTVNVLGGAARIASFVLVAFLLQRVLQMDPGAAGMAMLPTSLIGFGVSVALLPKLLNRFGPERVAAIGCLLLAAAHAVFAAVQPGSSYALHVLPGLALAASGVAMSFTPTTLILATEVSRRDVGVGSGLASASAQLGGMLGIAVFGAVEAAANGRPGAGHVDAASAGGLSAAFLVAVAFAAAAGVLTIARLVPRRAARRMESVEPRLNPTEGELDRAAQMLQGQIR